MRCRPFAPLAVLVLAGIPAARGACPLTLEQLCGGAPSGDPSLASFECDVNQTVSITGDDAVCRFSSAGTLSVRPNVTVSCDRPYSSGATEPCTLDLRFDGGIRLGAGATLLASHVQLTSSSPIVLGEGAHVSADGMGRCGAAAHAGSEGSTTYGAGHGGFGGTCVGQGAGNSGGQPFGDATMPFTSWAVSAGSGTSDPTHADRQCCGGGVVVLETTSFITLEGASVTADGQAPCVACPSGVVPAAFAPLRPGCRCCDATFPTCAGGSGASGGTLIVEAASPGALAGAGVPINGSGILSAHGASADMACDAEAIFGAGGAGGRIKVPLLRASGVVVGAVGGAGRDLRDCGPGAAGTQYSVDDDMAHIYINNGGQNSGTHTYTYVTVADDHRACKPPSVAIGAIFLSSGALLGIPPRCDFLKVSDELHIKDAVLSVAAALEVNALGQLVSSGRAQQVYAADLQLLASSQIRYDEGTRDEVTRSMVELHVGTLSVSLLSSVTSLRLANVTGSAIVDGSISSAGSLEFVVGGRLALRQLATLRAATLRVIAAYLDLVGKVQATDPPLVGASPLNCTDFDSNPHAMLMRLGELYVDDNGIVAAGAIGICATSSTILGKLTTSGLGPNARTSGVGEGLGSGCAATPGGAAVTGPGSGAGHGGSGGSAGLFQNQSGCDGGGRYGQWDSPATPGSGGGGPLGGSGGGVLAIVTDYLELRHSGWISSNGQDARIPLGATAAESGGGGGGAGGSVFITAREVDVHPLWTGAIAAHGGDAGDPGGGGGGGGWVHLSAGEGDVDWEAPPLLRLLEFVELHGGAGGTPQAGGSQIGAGQPGASGNLSGPLCRAGRTGVVCQPCPLGTFSDMFGSDTPCFPCPEGSYASEPGSTTCAQCPSGKATVTEGRPECSSCPGVGTYANDEGTCSACDSKPGRSEYVAEGTCLNSTRECVCSYVCRSTFVSLGNMTCGPLLDVVLLHPAGEIGRGAILLAPPALCGLVLLLVARAARRSSQLSRAGDNLPRARPGGGSRPGKRGRAAAKSEEDAMEMGAPPKAPTSLAASDEDRGVARLRGEAERSSEAKADGERPDALSGGSLLSRPDDFEPLAHAMVQEENRHRGECHVHRIGILGTNSSVRPWRLPPLDASLRRLIASDEAYYSLCSDFETAAAWSQWEVIVHAFLTLALPPLGLTFSEWRRRAHLANAICVITSITGARSERLWRNLHSRVGAGYRLELGCCALAAHAWLDVFNSSKAELSLMQQLVPNSGAPDARRLSHEMIAASASEMIAHGMRGGVRTGVRLLRQPTKDKDVKREKTPRRGSEAEAEVGPAVDKARTSGGEFVSFESLAAVGGAPVPKLKPLVVAEPTAATAAAATSRDSLALDPTPRVRMSGGAGGAGGAGVNVLLLPLCGKGTFLSPFWLEVSDFRVANALSDALNHSARSVATCLNALLQRVDRADPDWRLAMRSVLALIDAVNRQLASASPRHDAREEADGDSERDSHAQQAYALGVAHAPNQERQLSIVVGGEAVHEWNLPKGHALMLLAHFSRDECAPLELPDFMPSPPTERGLGLLTACCTSLSTLQRTADAAFGRCVRAITGTLPPHPKPLTAAAALLLLQLVDAALTVLLLGTICVSAEGTGACAATLAVLPFAPIISPLVGLASTLGVASTVWRARGGAPCSIGFISSGGTTRWLHSAAAWNAACLPNLFCCTLAVQLYASRNQLFTTSYPWLLPLASLLTKLLIAQASKLLSASASMIRGAHPLLAGLTGERRLRGASVAGGRPPATSPPRAEARGDESARKEQRMATTD